MILKTKATLNDETTFTDNISDFSFIRPQLQQNPVKFKDIEEFVKECEIVITDAEEDAELWSPTIIFYRKDNTRYAEVLGNDAFLMNDQGQTIERIIA